MDWGALRAQFAAAALQGVLSQGYGPWDKDDDRRSELAALCWRLADAMVVTGKTTYPTRSTP
jgi:hypothetical protein